MTVYYEWTVEIVEDLTDPDSDIIDTTACDSLKQALHFMGYDPEHSRLVLVRNVGNDDEGLTDRLWAYVDDGKLPDYFEASAGNETSVRVPAKFHQELVHA
jgi:hypothetical protein